MNTAVCQYVMILVNNRAKFFWIEVKYSCLYNMSIKILRVLWNMFINWKQTWLTGWILCHGWIRLHWTVYIVWCSISKSIFSRDNVYKQRAKLKTSTENVANPPVFEKTNIGKLDLIFGQPLLDFIPHLLRHYVWG